MKKYQLVEKANKLFEEHGIPNWEFTFDDAKSRYGQCRHNDRVITMSRVLLPLMKDEDVMDTLLHEIAHALVGVGCGHGWKWKRKARELGCNTSCRNNKHDRSKLRYKYTLTCPKCGAKVYRDKKTRGASGASCAKCAKGWHSDRVLVWVQNF